MINIAMIDDDKNERNKLKECLSFVEEKENIKINLTEFSSGYAFIGNYKPVYDIILLDIEMPHMDGLETARMIRKQDSAVILIFITNMAQFVIRGYEVEALDFILKPVNPPSLAMKLHRAITRAKKQVNDNIVIKSSGDMYNINKDSIKYLESDGHYITFHTTEGNFCECIPLKEAIEKIDLPHFTLCNRSFYVNMCYIDSIKDNCVIIGKDVLPISRPRKKQFLMEYSTFLGGKFNR